VGYPAEVDFNLTRTNAPFGNSALRIDVKNLTAYPWDVQLSQKGKSLNSGQQYKLSFWSKSDAMNGELYLAIINADFYVYHGEKFKLTNDWAYYETNYAASTTDIININIDLGFKIGAYYLDNLQFTTPELLSANQIENADFFKGDTYWNFITLSSAQAKDTVINGELLVSIANGGIEVWDIHLGQSGLYFENGKEYTISFDAYAETPRTISVIAGMSESPWTVYSGNRIYPILTEKRTFSFSFIMNDATDDKARFGFDIGGSTVNVFFDNIRVSSGNTPVGISKIQTTPISIQLFQNFPNPFNPETKIRYTLPKASDVKIEVLNVLGQRVVTLVDGNQPRGVHIINFNASHLASGLYFYTFEAADVRFKRKMLLLK